MSGRPFVYIAGLIRTGSTALSEALSEPGRALIIREPRLGTNRIVLRDADLASLARLGTEADRVLAWPRRVMGGLRTIGKGGHMSGGAGEGHLSGYAARVFRDRIVAPLSRKLEQVGIKEVRHDGWEHVLAAFPDLACVAIGRDPRDVYLSHRVRVGKKGNDLPTPAAFAGELSRQFALQRALIEATGALAIRYEDLCQDSEVLPGVRAHVQSPVTGSGSVGQFTSAQSLRQSEAELHGDALTDRRVARWTREADPEALTAATEVFERLGAYTEYWGYDPDGLAPTFSTTRLASAPTSGSAAA
ncbi:MAG: hypothetical protein AAGI52_15130 [Bacteroidota bacterium]